MLYIRCAEIMIARPYSAYPISSLRSYNIKWTAYRPCSHLPQLDGLVSRRTDYEIAI